MNKRLNDPVSLEIKLGAYLVAVGASFAVSAPVEATIVYHEGPWTATGTDTTLVSFNLAGDVRTDGTNVTDEQFFFGHQQGSFTAPGGASLPSPFPSKKVGGQGIPTTLSGTQINLFVQGRGGARALGQTGVTGSVGNVNAFALPLKPSYNGIQLLVGQQGLQLANVPSSTKVPGTLLPPSVVFANQANLAAVFNISGTSLPGTNTKFPGGKPPTLATKFGGGGPAGTVVGGGFTPGTEAFLGLLFDGPGAALYPGWADVRVDSIDSVSLLGYAYEDTGAPIRVGDTGNGQTTTMPEPGTLSLLALGAAGLAALRRRRRGEGADQGARDQG